VTSRRFNRYPTATTTSAMATDPKDPAQRRRNVRTALVLLSIAAVFFIGIVANYIFYG
jgi:hypothetical protein